MKIIKFYFQQMRLNAFADWLLWAIDIVKNFRHYAKLNIRLASGVRAKLCKFEGHNYIGRSTRIYKVEMGYFSYVSHAAIVSNAKIGRFCSIGMNVLIGPGRHPVHYISTHPFFFSPNHEANGYNSFQTDFEETKPIVIGNDVWIGANCIIMDGVSIGTGAIIAAGAVVTKNVAPYEIVGGVPAKRISKRFSDEKIEGLLCAQWWNKDLDILVSMSSSMCETKNN